MTPSAKSFTPLLIAAAAACAAVVGIVMPSAGAAPTTDDRGFVDSTARCGPPDTAAAFGSTATSRVAICASPNGQFEYRGVRVRDGAKLILAATRSTSGAFVAESDGITYTFTSSSLTVSAGSRVLRDEPVVGYHGSGQPSPPIPAAAPETPTPTAPLPPPLPAEQGHS